MRIGLDAGPAEDPLPEESLVPQGGNAEILISDL